MKKTEMIKRYVREANNLNHNIKFELDKGDQPSWNGQTDHRQVQYMKGQLSIIREIVHFLRNEEHFLFNTPNLLDYRLGDPIKCRI